MYAAFPLFQSHLDLAHRYWKQLITAGDIVIDATCGNGYDAEFLSSLGAIVHAFDIQKEAIEKTKQRLPDLPLQFYEQCHSQLSTLFAPESIQLVVYNLGYLPGSDKTVKTHFTTTLHSIKGTLPIIKKGGVISITCYPGHKEGEEEELGLLEFCKTLSPHEWNVCHHRHINRAKAPSLLLLQKANRL